MSFDPTFRAPWSRSLRLVTGFVTALFLACAWSLSLTLPDPASMAVAAVLLGIWIGAALFTVRGYSVSTDALRVRRLLWQTVLPLTGLIGATADPEAMRRSLRLAGNGGLFSFSGRFTNRRLGRYRAFATAPERAVVLELPRQKVVVTPEDPRAFLGAIRVFFPTAKVARSDS
ncbi:MAG: hypothetical protein KBA72_09785 [Thermoanaerobaculia bacterium]|nr:hypothetical protein [Thermoanaerobaculia bacterium]